MAKEKSKSKPRKPITFASDKYNLGGGKTLAVRVNKMYSKKR